MSLANLASHISAAIASETAKRGAPISSPGINCLCFRYPDGAISLVHYNEKAMQWEHTLRGV